jgi:N-acetylmuramic acid 6-phosphate etherase
MTRSQKQFDRPLFLGIEGGGTHTIAILADAEGQLLKRFETGPGNVKLLSDVQLRGIFKSIATAFPRPDALGIGLAGARTEADWWRIRTAAAKVWPSVPCQATNDLETALAAAEEVNGKQPAARVLVLSGTGSCCYGVNAAGKSARVGGWGHLLGDSGSAYEISLMALRFVILVFDLNGEWVRLGAKFLQRLELNEPDELIGWAQAADKAEIASLAVEVFDEAKRGDRMAISFIKSAEMCHERDAIVCARKLTIRGTRVQFVFAGSVLLKQPGFAKDIKRRILKEWPEAIVTSLIRESCWGAVSLAKRIWSENQSKKQTSLPRSSLTERYSPQSRTAIPHSTKISPTEQRNPHSMNFDKLSVAQGIELMLSEDAKIPAAILHEKKNIGRAVTLVANAFKNGGRLFYVGAGTSGRLGVLDASECPPTFRTAPEMVQGIIAGGQSALWRSIEGAEDDSAAGARAIEFRKVNRRDVVVGIAASGRTPFVWGAFGEAKRRGAKTILLAFNPYLKISRSVQPTLVITPNLGPEILTGSTRLKAGTATKLILNIFTTLAMVRLGKVISNLMVDMNPSNVKLRDRAVRIVQELRGVDYATAEQALRDSGWVIKRACARLATKKNPASINHPD